MHVGHDVVAVELPSKHSFDRHDVRAWHGSFVAVVRMLWSGTLTRTWRWRVGRLLVAHGALDQLVIKAMFFDLEMRRDARGSGGYSAIELMTEIESRLIARRIIIPLSTSSSTRALLEVGSVESQRVLHDAVWCGGGEHERVDAEM